MTNAEASPARVYAFPRLADLVREAYDNSKAHGFHPPDQKPETVPFAEKIALIHSEITEVYLAVKQTGRREPLEFVKDGKPEGVAVELADVFIRVCDLWGSLALGTGCREMWRESSFADYCSETSEVSLWRVNPEKILMGLHASTSLALEAHRARNKEGMEQVEDRLETVLFETVKAAQMLDVEDFAATIERKMKFNRSRPIKHGKLY